MLPTNRICIHPGEMLKKEWVEELNINKKAFAILLKISERDLQSFLDGKRSCSPQLAATLARTLGTTQEFWMNLQDTYNKRAGRKALSRALIPGR